MSSTPKTNRKRLILGTLILLVVSSGFAILLAEFTVRTINSDITTTADNKSYFARKWYKDNPPTKNELGFREKEIGLRQEGTIRIAVIGDSFTYGQGILSDDRYTNLLQASLNRGDQRYEILNFGRPGAESHHHLQILNEAVLDTKPDFILLQWFVNDVEISHAGRSNAKPLVPGRRLGKILHTRSALYYLANRGWGSFQQSQGMVEDYLVNMTRRFEDPTTDESKTATEAFDALIKTIEENNIPMGIVLFPLLAEVDGDPDAYPLGFLMDRVLATCAERQLQCLDLRPVYAPITATNKLWVNRYDKHPSAYANELAHDAISEKFAPIWAGSEE